MTDRSEWGRRLRSAALAASLVVATVVLVGASPAAASSATISAHVSAASVRVGWPVLVQGRVDPANVTPHVVVQRAVSGAWSDRATSGPLRADGTFSVRITPHEVGTYTLRVRSAGGGIASARFTLKVVPPPTISATLSTTSVAIGTPVLLSGVVKPSTATTRVVSQRYVDGRWVDRESAPVNPSTGSYAIGIRPSQVATYAMRVRSAKGSVHSPTVRLSTFYVAYDMVDTGNARPGEKVVAFTFDDGPHPTYTSQMLDVLAKHHVKATFSVVGYLSQAHPELLRRMVREGHRIANHSWDHPALTRLSDSAVRSQLSRTQSLIRQAGTTSRCVRPPYGSQNSRVQQLIAEQGASATLLWNVDPSNYRRPGSGVVVSRVMSALRPGAIIGMHDNNAGTVAAIDQLIPMIRAKGYQIRAVC